MKIKKAVIPAAGLGTRFLPATKAVPKEMLPLIDIPTIQYIVEEAVASGIEEILIITSGGKSAIENHFDINRDLENHLIKNGDVEMAERVRKIADLVKIFYVRQKEAKGLGHAIGCAESFVGNEPFAILLGDDVVISQKPALKQLIEAYEKTGASVLGVQEVPLADTRKYGIVAERHEGQLSELCDLVEKPEANPPSKKAILGRYVLTPVIFDLLRTQAPGKKGEIQLTDAIKRMLEKEKVYGYVFEGRRYDVGDKIGFIKATLEIALKREDIKNEVQALVNSLAK